MATMRPFGFPGGDPFRELRRLQDEMDRLAGALAPAGGPTLAAAGFPAVNLHAGRDGVAVVAEVPGVEAGDLEVQAHGDTLTIAGTRRPPAEDARAYHRRGPPGGALRPPPPPRRGGRAGLPPAGAPGRRLRPHRPAPLPGRPGEGRGAARGRGAAAEPAAARGGQAAPDHDHRLSRTTTRSPDERRSTCPR